MRLMSTMCCGRAKRKLSRGTSDWPPASTFASSFDARSEQASSTVVGAWYSNCAGFKSLHDRDRAAERRLAALEAPREAPELDPRVKHLVDLAAEVLDVDHVVREQQRVHDLVVRLWEDLVETAAELLLRLLGLVGADPPDHGVHRVVGAAGVDSNPSHASFEHPLREHPRRAGMADEVLSLVDLRAVAPVLGVVAVVAGMDDQDVAAFDAKPGVLLPPFEVLGAVHVEI